MQVLGQALLQLLETPLEEELFTSWAQLLEVLTHSYTPTAKHLALCFTLFVHPRSEEEPELKTTCQRIILRVSHSSGPHVFKDVIRFESFGVARNNRKKIRQSLDETDVRDDVDDATDLTTKESLFVCFENLWDCLGHALRSGSYVWLQLASTLILILYEEWNSAIRKGHDLAKTLIVQHLRYKHQKEVDLNRLLETLHWPKHEHDGTYKITMDDAADEAKRRVCMQLSAQISARLHTLLHEVATTKGLKVLNVTDLYAAIANQYAEASPITLKCYLDVAQNAVLIMHTCEHILFRQANREGKSARLSQGPMDLDKLSTWVSSIARGSDPIKVARVEILKATLLTNFSRFKQGGKLSSIAKRMLRSIGDVLKNLKSSLDSDILAILADAEKDVGQLIVSDITIEID